MVSRVPVGGARPHRRRRHSRAGFGRRHLHQAERVADRAVHREEGRAARRRSARRAAPVRRSIRSSRSSTPRASRSPLATLRCTAKTSVTFRDHDSVGPGIRLDAWNELAIDDYLFVNGELIRILALPKGPDDDCQFYQVAGQRVGVPRHDADAPQLRRADVQGRNSPAGQDVPAERNAGVRARLPQRRRRRRATARTAASSSTRRPTARIRCAVTDAAASAARRTPTASPCARRSRTSPSLRA